MYKFNYENREERYGNNTSDNSQPIEEEIDERLKNIEPKMIELIKNEIMDSGAKVEWDDIAGLEFAKATIQVYNFDQVQSALGSSLRV